MTSGGHFTLNSVLVPACLQLRRVAFGENCVKIKIRVQYQRQKCTSGILVSGIYKLYLDIRGGSLETIRQTTVKCFSLRPTSRVRCAARMHIGVAVCDKSAGLTGVLFSVTLVDNIRADTLLHNRRLSHQNDCGIA